MEFSVQIPYMFDEDVRFDGGASVEIDSDVGFGLALGYHYTENMAVRGSTTWNSTGYYATRILDDGQNTADGFSGIFDTFTFALGNDFYFTQGQFSPFVNLSLGYTIVDSNINDGGAYTVCWWDPWWGYICDTYASTYQESYWFYGAGAGLRLDLNRTTFLRVSYTTRWLDLDNARDTSDFSSMIFEFGTSF